MWVTEADEAKFPSLKAGDAYYITTSIMNDNGLTWDIVVVQKVVCTAGYFANAKTLMCEECLSPFWSGGNAPVVCDRCIKGYFMDHGVCTECPDGAVCKHGVGSRWLGLGASPTRVGPLGWVRVR